MFNCKKLFKPQIRPPSLILLIITSQDWWIFPSQSWEVRNSMMMVTLMMMMMMMMMITPVCRISSLVGCLLLHAGKYCHFYMDNFLETSSVQISGLISVTTRNRSFTCRQYLHQYFDILLYYLQHWIWRGHMKILKRHVLLLRSSICGALWHDVVLHNEALHAAVAAPM